MIWIAYAAMWISTAAAASYGVYITGSASCLWALLVPAFVHISTNSHEDRDTEEREESEGESS